MKAITYYDTPERSDYEVILRTKKLLIDDFEISQILECFPELAVVLNENREIVAFNKKALVLFKNFTEDEIYGKRVGEALGCIHANDEEAGCGTSIFCRECGAAKSIRTTRIENISEEMECRITALNISKEFSLDLRVTTSNIYLDGLRFIIFAIKDISEEKRRLALEKIFFHDVLNTAGAIHGISSILQETDSETTIKEFSSLLENSAQQLVNEIQMQRDLRNAENGILFVDIRTGSVNMILSDVHSQYQNHSITKGKLIDVKLLDPDIEIQTDMTLIKRCLGNLLKNAIEATESKVMPIEIFAIETTDKILFNVKNQTVIPEEVQRHIFYRSFSTKEKSGRGIGTYSVKLLAESYLKGKVYFVSTEETKTIFTIALPKKFRV